MRSRLIPVWIALGTALFSRTAVAQYADWEQYTCGLHVTALAEAPDAVWVGTTGGLLKVNKTTLAWIQQFNTANSGLPSNNITSLSVDADGGVWIGMFGRGLSRFDGTSVFTNYRRSASGLASDTVSVVAVSGDTVWIGTHQGISSRRLSNSAWLPIIRGASYLPSDTVNCLARSHGDFWAGTPRGIVRWNGQGSVNMNLNLQNVDIRGVTVAVGDSIWIATAGGGAARLEPAGSWRIFDTASTGGRLPTSLLNTIQADPTNGVWIGTPTDGLVRHAGAAWTVYDTTNSSLPDNAVTALQPALTGAGVWIGTRGGGLARFSGSTWTTPSAQENELLEEGLIAVAATPAGGRWACGRNFIYVSDGVNVNSFSSRSMGLAGNEFTSLAVDAQGRAWVGTNGSGVFHYNGTDWTRYSLDVPTTGFPDDFVNSVAVSPANGDVWIATFNGVGRFNGSAWTTYNTGSSVAPLPAGAYEIQRVVVGGDGTVWISDMQSPGPIRFNAATPSWVTTDAGSVGISAGTIQALWAGGTGDVWVGTADAGIARHSAGTWGSHLTTGLPSLDVRSIQSDLDGNLWIGTAGGLARVTPPTGTAGAAVANVYRVGSSGLPANSVRAVAVSPDNRIYAGTDSGGAIFNGFRRIPEPAVTIRNRAAGLTRFFMYDTLDVNGSDTLTTYIVNTGTGDLTIDSLTVFQNGPLAFSLLSRAAPPAITVAAGDSLPVTVRFHPAEVAFCGGQVRIVTNAASSPDIIFTGGSVRAASLSFTGDAVHVHTGMYSFFSIPYVLADPRISTVLHSLGTYGGSNWRLFYFKNGGYLEYSSFSPSDNLNFRPGIAYWIISRNPLELTLNDVSETPALQWTTPTTAQAVNYAITLRHGWNMIGNPYAYPVQWSQIMDSTGTDSVYLQAPVVYNVALETYSYNQTRLETWRGYFIYNHKSASVTLRVPPMPALARGAHPRTLAGQEFILELSGAGVESGVRSGITMVGMLRAAEDGNDRLDFLEAPPIGERPDLAAIDAKGNRYAGDFRAVSDAGASWDLALTPAKGDERVVLRLDGLDRLAPGFRAWILDTDGECCLALTDGRVETAAPKAGSVLHLRLLVGTEEYAESASRGMPLEPHRFALLPNYPNPFNPETRIEYSLARKSPVSVDVYDGLGRRIRNLESGVRTAGPHDAVWDGRDDSGRPVPSGVYVCRVRAGDFATSRKMALIR